MTVSVLRDLSLGIVLKWGRRSSSPRPVKQLKVVNAMLTKSLDWVRLHIEMPLVDSRIGVSQRLVCDDFWCHLVCGLRIPDDLVLQCCHEVN